jgi:hypothetical protein
MLLLQQSSKQKDMRSNPKIHTPQLVCAPVAHEFGTTPSPELMADPDFSSIIDDVATQAEAMNARHSNELGNGVAADKALKSLGLYCMRA